MMLIDVIVMVYKVLWVSFFLIVGDIVLIFGLVLYLFLKYVLILVIFFLDGFLINWVVVIWFFLFESIMFFGFMLRELKFFLICCVVKVWLFCMLICVLFVKLIFRLSLKISKMIIFVIVIVFEKIKKYFCLFVKFYFWNVVCGLVFLFVFWMFIICFFLMLN